MKDYVVNGHVVRTAGKKRSLRIGDNLEDLFINWRIILKCISKKWKRVD
jgi:hypothetical protein